MKSGLKHAQSAVGAAGPSRTIWGQKGPLRGPKLSPKLSPTLAVVVGAILVCVACGERLPAITVTAQEQASAKAFVDTLQELGSVRSYSCDMVQAYVPPEAWQRFDAKGKQHLAAQLAATCYTADRGFRITIIDSQSGKRLARVDTLGYHVE